MIAAPICTIMGKLLLPNVDILPYFTAVNDTKVDEVTNETTNTDGYILIPDGSGAIMNFNNGKTTYTQYLSKRVYSTDTAFASEVKQVEKEDILLPMYAVISQNKNGAKTIYYFLKIFVDNLLNIICYLSPI